MTSETKGRLLGSAPNLRGIREVIAAFYGGERKILRPLPTPGTWGVYREAGTRIQGVIVRGNGTARFRFETAPREGNQ